MTKTPVRKVLNKGSSKKVRLHPSAKKTPSDSLRKRAFKKRSRTTVKGGSLNLITKKNTGDVQEKIFSIDDFDVGKKLGIGKFGKVYLAREKRSGYVCALKVLYKKRLRTHNVEHTLKREIEIMKEVRHKNVLRLHGYFFDAEKIYLILEFAAQGEMFDHLRLASRFNEKRTARYVADIADALVYLHEKNIMHRDIKPENLLLDDQGRIKLSDFGWSVHTIQRRITLCGTAEYLPPEMVAHRNHGSTVDTWALGILTYEFLTGNSPFVAKDQKQIFSRIAKLDLKFPDSMSQRAKDFISKLLQKDPDKRMQLRDVPEQPFIKENLKNYGEKNKTKKRRKKNEGKQTEEAAEPPKKKKKIAKEATKNVISSIPIPMTPENNEIKDEDESGSSNLNVTITTSPNVSVKSHLSTPMENKAINPHLLTVSGTPESLSGGNSSNQNILRTPEAKVFSEKENQTPEKIRKQINFDSESSEVELDDSQSLLLDEDEDSSILDPSESLNNSFDLSNNSLLNFPISTANQSMVQSQTMSSQQFRISATPTSRLQNSNLSQLTQENKLKNSLIGSQVKPGQIHYVDESMHMDSDTDNFEFSQIKISPSMSDVNNFLDNSHIE